MKFTVNSLHFHNIASSVVKGLGVKDSQAQTVFRVIDEDTQPKLLMQTRSQSSLFKGTVALNSIVANDDEPREWGIDGQQLKTILSIIPKFESTVEFNMGSSNRQFLVEFNGNKFKLPVYEAPSIIADEQYSKLAVVDANVFYQNTSNLLKLTSTDLAVQNHPISCLNIFIDNSGLTYVASNSIAIAEVKQEIADFESTTNALIKTNQANLLISSASDASDVLTLVASPTMFGHIDKYGTLSLVSKVSMAPLEYSGVKALASTEQTVLVKKEEFKYTIDSLAKLCPTSDELTFKLKDNEILVENDNQDVMPLLSEGQVEDTDMIVVKPTLSIISSLLTDEFKMSWPADNGGRKMIQFQNLVDGEVDDNIFIGVTTNG